MSIHRSLASQGKLARKRSVLTRAERVAILRESGRLTEDGSAYGLPKVRTIVKARKSKKAKKAEEKKEEAATKDAKG